MVKAQGNVAGLVPARAGHGSAMAGLSCYAEGVPLTPSVSHSDYYPATPVPRRPNHLRSLRLRSCPPTDVINRREIVVRGGWRMLSKLFVGRDEAALG